MQQISNGINSVDSIVQDPTISRQVMSERDRPIRGALNNVSQHITNIRRRVAKSTNDKLDSLYGNILSSPATVVILLVIIAAFLLNKE